MRKLVIPGHDGHDRDEKSGVYTRQQKVPAMAIHPDHVNLLEHGPVAVLIRLTLALTRLGKRGKIER